MSCASILGMEAIIFIFQRITLASLATLTFLGITTEETYFATEDRYNIPQERKEAVEELLEDPETVVVFENESQVNINDAERLNKEDRDSEKKESILEKTLDKILNTSQEGEDFFMLPTEVLEEEAKEHGVVIPDDLQEKPLPVEEYKEQKAAEIEKNLNTITKQLEEIKEKTQTDVVVETTTPEPIPAQKAKAQTTVIPRTVPNSVVSIVCLERIGNTLSVSTGSGVFINKEGTLVTNAHVAQNLLKQDDPNVDCEAKHPNHPTMRFRVAILHMPKVWLGGRLLGVSHGTGEDDFAFLSVVGPSPDGVIPVSFPYIEVDAGDSGLVVGNDILLAGYPGKQTGNLELDTNLPLVQDTSVITDVFTFGGDSIDVISSGASPVAKQGSSGGAIVDQGELIGLIVTTNPASSGGNYLNGLTFNYIKQDLAENGLSLESFL